MNFARSLLHGLGCIAQMFCIHSSKFPLENGGVGNVAIFSTGTVCKTDPKVDKRLDAAYL